MRERTVAIGMEEDVIVEEAAIATLIDKKDINTVAGLVQRMIEELLEQTPFLRLIAVVNDR